MPDPRPRASTPPDFADVRHDCVTPSMGHLPSYGARHQVIARWKCPECGQRWRYAAQFMDHDRMYWERTGTAHWRWLRAERKRLRDEWMKEHVDA